MESKARTYDLKWNPVLGEQVPSDNTSKASTSGERFPTDVGGKELASLYANGHYEGLLDHICKWLQGFAQTQIKEITPVLQRSFDTNAETLGYFLSRTDLNFKQSSLLRLLKNHQAFSNIFANSCYGNADQWIKPRMNNNKISVLYLPLLQVRNSLAINRSDLFKQNNSLSSEWYGQYLFGVRSFINKNALLNLKEHLSFWDPRMEFCLSMSNGYMRSTYIDPALDRLWKSNFNNLVKQKFSFSGILNKPNPKSIAVLTARWANVHPTYKNRLPLFEALAERFDLTLVHLGPERKDIDTRLFKKVVRAGFHNGRINSPELFNNNFSMAFYPDIGMNVESRFLSNLRIAPIQVTSNSHPVSTFGSEIDFFLTGKDSEESPSAAQRHYSERLVLLPGIGTLPVLPKVKVTAQRKSTSNDKVVTIACPWGSLKVNYPLIEALNQIKKGAAKTRVRFRFLMTLGPDSGHLPPIHKDLIHHLGPDSVELFADLPYDLYMQRFSECDFALDAFPFGGNTSIIDSIYLQKPMVSRVGWQFYNRAGPEILKRCGLAELCATSEDAYINKALQLINDSHYFETVIKNLESVDLKAVLSQLSSKSAFVDACEYLIKERPDPRLREPLLFS